MTKPSLVSIDTSISAKPALRAAMKAGSRSAFQMSLRLDIGYTRVDCLYVDKLQLCVTKNKRFSTIMTPEQCKAARALSGLSQADLAELSNVAVSTIIPFEQRQRSPRRSTILKLRTAFEASGIQFIEENGGGPGVRLREQDR